MGVDHDLIRKLSLTDKLDKMLGVFDLNMERRSDFVPDAGIHAVPLATGIGKVEYLVVIDVKIWFADDAKLPVIILFPKIPVVVF